MLGFVFSQTVSRTAATEAYERQQAKYEQEARERAERKALERSNKEKEKARLAQEKVDRAQAKRNPQQARVKRPPFNFEKVSHSFYLRTPLPS